MDDIRLRERINAKWNMNSSTTNAIQIQSIPEKDLNAMVEHSMSTFPNHERSPCKTSMMKKNQWIFVCFFLGIILFLVFLPRLVQQKDYLFSKQEVKKPGKNDVTSDNFSTSGSNERMWTRSDISQIHNYGMGD